MMTRIGSRLHFFLMNSPEISDSQQYSVASRSSVGWRSTPVFSWGKELRHVSCFHYAVTAVFPFAFKTSLFQSSFDC